MPPPTADPPDDPQVFPLLESFLEDLHAGRRPDKQKLLAAHPELASALDCLEAIEELAPPPPDAEQGDAAVGRGSSQDAPTLALESTPSLPAGPRSLPADFGKYELLAELGRGGMGVVYKARQKDLDRFVAIKMILASSFASDEQVQRFHAEARAAARLQHPHIVTIYEAGEIHGQHYFAMPYVGGPSVAAVLKEGHMDAETAARLVCAVARTVQHLHEHDIVHRDLKPSNILLDEQEQPHVTDFGLVKMLQTDSHLTYTGAIVGTPSYMAPEQAAGRAADVGPLSDLYSLGAILYEMLTGRPPFSEANPLDTLVQVLEGEPARPSDLNPQVPRALERICLKCLEKNPEERYASAAALADDLDRFLKGEDVEAQQLSIWRRLRRWSRREPALSSRLAGLAICALIAQANYHLARDVALWLHVAVMGVLALWALASVVFQLLLRRGLWPDTVRFAWAGTDVVLLTVVLQITVSLTGPLIVGYPVLIGASGLWFRVRLVWFTTLVAEAGYGALVLMAPGPVAQVQEPHWHLIFAAALAVLGFMVAYQVQRVRALSRYYEHRPLP